MIMIIPFASLLLLTGTSAFSSSIIPSRMTSGTHSLHMSRRPLMGGNWKLNPTKTSVATKLATDLAKMVKSNNDVDVVIFPPHPFLVPVFEKVEATNVQLGAQNCYFESTGPYTGSVSTCMLKDVGVTHVLCGHSERRTLFKDNDRAIRKKVKKVLTEGLSPVLCLGETLEEYEAGLNHEVCAIQLLKDLNEVTPEEMSQVVIAYEPVWAIGTGLVCAADVAQDVHAFIRSVIRKKYGQVIADEVLIQYGGSVKPDNVKEIMSMPDIDGCLVGGASLAAESFASIVNYQSLNENVVQ